MSESVVVALITGICAVIGQWLISRRQSKDRETADAEKEKRMAVEQAVKDERINSRLESIERKLDIHNGYAEKLGEISTSIAVIENDIKTLYKKGESYE